MTHAQTPSATSRHSDKPAPGSPGAEAEDLLAFRRMAERMDLPEACPHKTCHSGGCRGQRAHAVPFPALALPACLACVFDAAYAPVQRWNDLMTEILDIADQAEAREAEAAGGAGADPPPARSRIARDR